MSHAKSLFLAIALTTASGCAVRARTTAGAQSAGAQSAGAQPDGTPAQPGSAQLLGARQVGFHTDHDAIQVGAARGRFQRMRLHVSGSPLEMYNVRVVFGDGSSFSPPTRLHFAQGSSSRDIDLPGGARVIERVEFWYETRGRQGRADVQLFGM